MKNAGEFVNLLEALPDGPGVGKNDVRKLGGRPLFLRMIFASVASLRCQAPKSCSR
jgi:hypothetical protein